MTRPSELRPGGVFFLLEYCDEALTIPFVRTLEFLKEEKAGGAVTWAFRDLSRSAADHGAEEGTSAYTLVDEPILCRLLDLAGLAAALAQDAEAAAGEVAHAAAVPSPDSEQRPELVSHVARFMAVEKGTSLMVQIRYTSDGFTISRESWRFPGLALDQPFVFWSFWLATKAERHREARIRQIFDSLGARLNADYTSSMGRVRILEYAQVLDSSAVVSLISKLLLEVYSMRVTDELVLQLGSE